MLFLTVSYHTSPYDTGADIVFFFAWIYENDHCRAQKGAPCDVRGCPFLQEGRASLVQRGPDDVDRRTVVVRGAVAAVAGRSGWA